jgi:cell division protein FtsI (penicillin-binding protein 3)
MAIFGGFILYAIWCVICAVTTLLDEDLKAAEAIARKKIVRPENFRRGNILSCDGKPLAAYYPEYLLYADFGVRITKNYTVDRRRAIADDKTKDVVKLDTFRINIYREFARALSKVVGGNAGDYYRSFYNNRIEAENAKRAGRDGWATEQILKNRINIFQRDEIFDRPFFRRRGRNISGIYANEVARRIYPFGNDFAHSVIGVATDNSVSGIEAIYDNELKNGDNIITTIDTRIQDICQTVLRRKITGDGRFVGGTIIVMEVATGDVKAMANLGSYDRTMPDDKIRDIYNNATRATIEPGSTFKPVSLMLALETGKVRISDRFNTKVWRRTVTERNSFDSIYTVSRIIERSSNIGTGNMVDRAFDRDLERFVAAIKALKITDRIGNMNEISPTINPGRDAKSMLHISYGYQVKMAPIHILSFYNAIANRGVMVKPRLVRGIVRRNGDRELFRPTIINRAICSSATLDSVRLVLSRVVGQGSAWSTAGTPYGVVGKTGTAQIYLGNKKYITANGLRRELSSFCGYFPQRSPEYSCIVVLYTRLMNEDELSEFSSSLTAVPVFKEISSRIYALYIDTAFSPVISAVDSPVIKNTTGEKLALISELLNIPITVSSDSWVTIDTTANATTPVKTSELALTKGTIPDVRGMGLRDAIFLLENRGFVVSYYGKGTIVRQQPESGVPYSSGQKILLTLK